MKTFFAVLVFSFAVIAAAHTLNAASSNSNQSSACPLSAVMAAGHPDVIAGLVSVSVETTETIQPSAWQTRVETALLEVQETRKDLTTQWINFLKAALATRYAWIWAFFVLALLVRL